MKIHPFRKNLLAGFTAGLSLVAWLASSGCTCVTINIGNTGGAGGPGGSSGQNSGDDAGGGFTPLTAYITGGGANTVCGIPVTATVAKYHPPALIPPTGTTRFIGSLLDESNMQIIPTNKYVLYFYVSLSNRRCAAPAQTGNQEVVITTTPGTSYLVSAHFKSGHGLANTTPIRLSGAFLP